MDPLKFAQLLCSRLCHDLITPVGTITNGLEILHDPSPIDHELFELTSHSAQNLAQRLIYYRAAFGYAGPQELKSLEKFQGLLKTYLESHKITLDFQQEGDLKLLPETLKKLSRLILNLAGVMIECAPYGGDLSISFGAPTAQEVTILLTLTGCLLDFKKDHQQALNGLIIEDAITAQNIQSYLSYLLAEQAQVSLQINSIGRDKLEVSIVNQKVGMSDYGSLF